MKNENANTKPTAIETYRQRREDIARLLDILDMELAKFGERAEAEPKDWGFAGTMGRYHEVFFAGCRSACRSNCGIDVRADGKRSAAAAAGQGASGSC